WASMLAGFSFYKKAPIALAATALLTFLILYVAHLSWMNPEITNLVPVLKSYWLTIHVAVITASYGFLALGAFLGILNMILILLQNKKNTSRIQTKIKELSRINEASLIAGLYLLTIGTFLGGIWANESWGRYWGWDPKETWAFVTILIYAFVVHMRMIPGLKSLYAFNVSSIFAYFSVLMTYFGVNYYLSGLHSYAQGDPMPVPNFVYYSVALLLTLSISAYFAQRKFDVK
ncbi:MAG: cytochrome c biogenesis protein CcsA, partial [Bacteroidota bacterium]